ncbi:hypothetical protein C3B58_21700 [Lactonifactor longoviformis]|uniref:LPXTG-motif cell wall anchor domain-containing protein n=1 Tax=Lactonifactor longoviformis DSM 17459 TaxID=1122155 RepID=A0A1M4YLU5_9CLOT|nr:LPXTG cell wall anchor domain-containing protein [Lactonifactor longoviformis]POP30365.1 hypothetical protein C3B58_21700 [Lactonifactor longoviformis]SHF06764.1 LPXTG-motif cell wall anchor domain-containing protein [Lactonifactor longoviformis DSM 17459]
MKKMIALLSAAVLTVATAVTAFALPSVSVDGVVTKTESAVDANGNAVTVEIKDVPEEYKAAVEEVKKEETIKELLGADFKEGMQVVDVKEVSVPEGTAFPVTITFSVPGVKEGTAVAVLHYNGSAWERITKDVKAGNGTITATFDSLSPVAFVVDKEAAEAASTSTSTSAKSPKTGEFNVLGMAGIVAIIALGGMAVTYSRKRKEA